MDNDGRKTGEVPANTEQKGTTSNTTAAQTVIRKKSSALPVILGVVLLLGALGMVLYFTVFSKDAVAGREIRRQMTEAEHFLDELDYEQAVACYQAVLELDPKNEEALEGLTNVYREWAESLAEEDAIGAEKVYAEAEEYLAELAEDEDAAEAAQEAVRVLSRAREALRAEVGSSLQEEDPKDAADGSGVTSNTDEDGSGDQNGGEDVTGESGQIADEGDVQAAGFRGAAVGSYVTFGHYEQDNDLTNGAEPVEWLVLVQEEDRTLLLSRYALDAQPYDAECDEVTWETSSLRSWLDEVFYPAAFSAEEQERILTVTNENPDSYEYYGTDYAMWLYGENAYETSGIGAPGGEPTEDRVFCLSWREALEYFNSTDEWRCAPTAYAVAQGVLMYQQDKEECSWWLRSLGYSPIYALEEIGGSLGDYIVGATDTAVRPAIWVR